MSCWRFFDARSRDHRHFIRSPGPNVSTPSCRQRRGPHAEAALPSASAGTYSDAIADSLSTLSWAEHLRQVAVPGADWLEFGCGASNHKMMAESCQLNWQALDIESAASKRRHDTTGVTYYDGLIIPFANATFDVVTSVQVLGGLSLSKAHPG